MSRLFLYFDGSVAGVLNLPVEEADILRDRLLAHDAAVLLREYRSSITPARDNFGYCRDCGAAEEEDHFPACAYWRTAQTRERITNALTILERGEIVWYE